MITHCIYLDARQPALNRGMSHGVRSAQMTPLLVCFPAVYQRVSFLWVTRYVAAHPLAKVNLN